MDPAEKAELPKLVNPETGNRYDTHQDYPNCTRTPVKRGTFGQCQLNGAGEQGYDRNGCVSGYDWPTLPQGFQVHGK